MIKNKTTTIVRESESMAQRAKRPKFSTLRIEKKSLKKLAYLTDFYHITTKTKMNDFLINIAYELALKNQFIDINVTQTINQMNEKLNYIQYGLDKTYLALGILSSFTSLTFSEGGKEDKFKISDVTLKEVEEQLNPLLKKN